MADSVNSFESGQSSGTIISTANSGGAAGRAFDTIVGTVTYDSTHAHNGSLAMKVDLSGGTTDQVQWRNGSNQVGADTYVRFYVWFDAYPTVQTSIVILADAAQIQLGRIRIKTTGVLDLLTGVPNAIVSTNTPVALGQWVRVEAKFTTGASTAAELRLYNTPDSTVPTEMVSGTSADNTGTHVAQWRYGANFSGTSTSVFWMDDVAADSVNWIGPQVPPLAPPAAINFPTDPADLSIEMNIAGTWTDLRTNGYVLDRGISISRGRSDEAGQIEPQKLSMTLDNEGGRFSPRNPSSPYYGVLGRNTPVRAYVRRGATYAELPESTDLISAPDSVGMSIVGDIDIRVDVTTSYWADTLLAGKYRIAGDQRSWAFAVDTNGTLFLVWTTAGTSASVDLVRSTIPIPTQPGRLALRVALDVSPTPTATFYTSDTISGTWTQLGSAVVSQLGTGTSIKDSTAPVELGYVTDNLTEIGQTYNGVVGRYNAFELRSGIGGTVVANPTFTGLSLGATTVADGHSNTWTLNGTAAVSDKRWRFHGEMSSLPPRWDVSGNDTYVTTDVNGMLRRLRAANTPLHSSIYRQVTKNNTTAAYWACEDVAGATSFAAATSYTPPARFTPGALTLAATTITGSEALPTMNKTAVDFIVPQYDTTNGSVAFFFLFIPTDTAMANGTVLASIKTTGTANRWDFVYYTASGGSIGVGVAKASDDAGVYSVNAPNGVTTNNLNGQLLLCSIGYKQNGTTMQWDFSTDPFGTGIASFSFTVADTPFRNATNTNGGAVSKITMDPDKKVDGVTFGHVGVWSGVPDFAHGQIFNGYLGEKAGDRLVRLCAEEGVPLRIIGIPAAMPQMGEQKAIAFTDLLQECADADHGMLFESRDAMALCYRTRGSLYSQSARLTLDYRAGGVSDAIEPTDDDQQVRNDVTVTRQDGSSARIEQATGPLSVNAPPNGVGRYADSQTYNLWFDEDLPDQAAWAVHLGTVDEARYPTIGINYAGEVFEGVAALNEAALSLEVGDRLTITNPPDSLPPDAIDQLVQGYSESYGNYAHTQAFNCSPESPYEVARLTAARVDSSGSQLATSYTSTDTSLSVVTTSSERWTTSSTYMPFDVLVGGERMTVTAISGTTTTQTFTVIRSVNGVVKAQTAGTPVNIFNPTYVGL